MANQNNGSYQSQQGKNNNQVKDNPQAGQRQDQNKKNANPTGQSDKKNLSGSDNNAEQE